MKKHNVIVIADEIYSLFNFQKDYIPPQLENLLSTVIGVASETYSCAPSPNQVAATKAYTSSNATDEFKCTQTY